MNRIISKNLSRKFHCVFTIALLFFSSMASGATLTPQQVADKAAAMLTGGKGISARFSITASGQKFDGTVNAQGNKFSVETPNVSYWHDGKYLYTYNPRTVETTLTEPTAEELIESNPLLYVNNSSEIYSIKFATKAVKGKYVLELTPKEKRSPVSLISITLNSGTFQPERIVIKSGAQTSTVTVNYFKSGLTLPQSTFSYPKTKYPKAEIIDLR